VCKPRNPAGERRAGDSGRNEFGAAKIGALSASARHDRQHRPVYRLVWNCLGHHDEFSGNRYKGAANLAVVAPGISEALVATAIGLGAAIPAVVAYNHFSTKIR